LTNFLEKVVYIIKNSGGDDEISNESLGEDLVYLMALAVLDRQLMLDAKQADPGLRTILNLTWNLRYDISNVQRYLTPLLRALQPLFPKRTPKPKFEKMPQYMQDSSDTLTPPNRLILKAVDEAMRDHTLFFIQRGSHSIGIGPPDVQLVIKPTSNISPSAAAFLLRPPGRPSASHAEPPPFRLSGLCFLEPFVHAPRPSRAGRAVPTDTITIV
jgi:hypothetical protein